MHTWNTAFWIILRLFRPCAMLSKSMPCLTLSWSFLTSLTLTSASKRAAQISLSIDLRTSSLMTVVLFSECRALVMRRPKSANTILKASSCTQNSDGTLLEVQWSGLFENYTFGLLALIFQPVVVTSSSQFFLEIIGFPTRNLLQSSLWYENKLQIMVTWCICWTRFSSHASLVCFYFDTSLK